jgi:hypothetical protein
MRAIHTSNATAIHEASFATNSVEHLVSVWIVNDANNDVATVNHADADGGQRDAVHEVRRAVNGIHNPGVSEGKDECSWRTEKRGARERTKSTPQPPEPR